MRIISIHHVPFEGLGSMENLVQEKNHTYSRYEAWKEPVYPKLEEFDFLIVMGGPMSVGDVGLRPWLSSEKTFIRKSMESGKTILGICLGAQLIAEAAGARVINGPWTEIGWHEVIKHPEADNSRFGKVLPQKFEAFHWHGDTFDIPDGALPIGRSEAYLNQGFVIDGRILALQFHLETTPDTAEALIANCSSDLNNPGDYVQDSAEMLRLTDRFNRINGIMRKIWVEMEKMRP